MSDSHDSSNQSPASGHTGGNNRQAPAATGRFGKHLRELVGSGLDTTKFREALASIKNDTMLSRTQRDALLRTIAQDQAIVYIEAVTGERVNSGPTNAS